MEYLFDIIMAAVLALSIFIGYKKGLIMTVFSLAAVLIAVITAQILSPYVNEALVKSGAGDKIAAAAASKIEARYEEEFGKPSTLSCAEIAEKMKLPQSISEQLEQRMENYREAEAFSDSVQKIGSGIASITLHLISYASIAIVTAAILFVVIFLIQTARQLPVVKTFDHAGGALFGVLRGVLIVFVVCAAVYAAAILADSSFADGIMEHSLIMHVFARFGILAAIL